MVILKSIICKPCTDDFTHILYISIANSDSAPFLLFYGQTNQPTDRPKKQSEMRRCMTTYVSVLVCLVACMRIGICALVIRVCTWSLYRRMYVNSSVHNGILKNTSIALEKENRMFNKDNYDICLWNVFNLHNRHSLCTYPFQLLIPLNTWLLVNKYEITYPRYLFIFLRFFHHFWQ